MATIMECFSDKHVIETIDRVKKNDEKTLNLVNVNCELPSLKELKSVIQIIIRDSLIEKLPKLPPELQCLCCIKCRLREVNFSKFPDTLRRVKFSDNCITNIINIENKNIEKLVLDDNFLTTLPTLPNTIKLLCVRNNPNLIKMNIPENVKLLDISNTGLVYDTFPDSIEKLDTSYCNLRVINHLPINLNKWYSKKSNICKINCKYPDTLTEIDISENPIENPHKINHQILYDKYHVL